MIEIVAAYDDDDYEEGMQDDSSHYNYVSPSLLSMSEAAIVVEEPAKAPGGTRDSQLQHLLALIDAKQQYLLRKRKEVRETSKQNEFLATVRDDYRTYNQFILRQKEEQLAAFQLLQRHLDELSQSGELSEQNAKDAKAEQQTILREIDSIRGSLDELLAEQG